MTTRTTTADIEAAAHRLRAGGLVAFPTETVYGLGADAANPAAVQRIFAAKGRPADHPLIVHLVDAAALDDWSAAIPPVARDLATHFWPGPLTLILRRARGVSDLVTGGQDTVGLRVPSHPLALALLQAFGGGVAAPSANRFGRISPTRARHVRAELGDRVDMILDGGACAVGVESTILSLAEARPRLLRPGAIPRAALEDVLGETITLPDPASAIRAPGLLDSHYAPRTPFEVWLAPLLEQRIDELKQEGRHVAAIRFDADEVRLNPSVPTYFLSTDPAEYARKLYALLRLLDGAGFDALLAQAPPPTESWRAVNDRLKRASRVSPFA